MPSIGNNVVGNNMKGERSNKIDMSIPSEGVELMEERRGRVEGRIDEEGNYHDTYKGDPVVGKRDGKTGNFQYQWDIKV